MRIILVAFACCVGDRNIGKLIKILYRLAKDLPE